MGRTIILINFIVRNITNLVKQVRVVASVKITNLLSVHSLVEDKLELEAFKRCIRNEMPRSVGVMSGRRVKDIDC